MPDREHKTKQLCWAHVRRKFSEASYRGSGKNIQKQKRKIPKPHCSKESSRSSCRTELQKLEPAKRQRAGSAGTARLPESFLRGRKK